MKKGPEGDEEVRAEEEAEDAYNREMDARIGQVLEEGL